MNVKLTDEIIKNNVEYELLPYQFFLLTFWGIWCPKHWSIKIRSFHNMLFILVFFLDFIICVEMFVHFVNSLGTNNFKLINLFFVSANITAVYKSLKLRRNREIIRSFIANYFNCEWMSMRDTGEIEIHEKINGRIRDVTITYSASMIGIVLLKAMSPLVESSTISLPVDAWYPYSIEKPNWFWITYLHQVILGSSAICAHIGVDTLFVGLLLKALCQINILKYRLQNLTNSCKQGLRDLKYFKDIEKEMIVQCIYHHERIYRFGKDLNSKFREILTILVISSLPNICINVYSLSAYTNDINVQYVATFFSTTSALLQFFLTCWFGNEITLSSLHVKNAVYEMDWTMFDVSTQKLLVIIMTRSSKPIQFSLGYVIPMNLQSFIKVIKSSYTAFNVLQQTGN